MIKSRPSIFDYLDYRVFLGEMIQYLRGQGEYSIRKFAARVGFKSNSYVKAIIDRRRNLSSKSVPVVAKNLKLSRSERDFFEALVVFNDTDLRNERERALRRLLNMKGLKKARRLQLAEYQFFSDWRKVALFAAIGSKSGLKHVKAISRQLGFSVSQMKSALQSLAALGLIEFQDFEKIKVLETAVQTASETNDLKVRGFHREMISEALKRVDEVNTKDRQLSALCLCLTPKQYEYVINRIAQLRSEITGRFAASTDGTSVYQVNFQAFRLINLVDESEGSSSEKGD